MNRYLLNIAYIGTKFRGIQKTVNKSVEVPLDNSTVQGALELALQTFRPINEISIQLSSRTDAGVHALHSTVHVDLENSHSCVYPTASITQVLNSKFHNNNLPIRILSTLHVPNTFHCRYNAKGRTYLYRIAIPKQSIRTDESTLCNNNISFIPIEEIDRCFFLRYNNFDIEKFKETAKLFVGLHDFRSFMFANKRNDKQKSPRYTLRVIESITINPGYSVTNIHNRDKAESIYDYWDITIRGRSFLHKQIRRTIGALIAVAVEKITKKDVYEMITIPSKHSWCSRAIVAPPYGLYLVKVHYDANDFKFPENI